MHASMRAFVCAAAVRTGFVRVSGSGGGEGAHGRKDGGAMPTRSVSRHAVRSAASSCHLDASMLNMGFVGLILELWRS